MMEAFGGVIPSAYFIQGGPRGKIPIQDAVQQGLIDRSFNIFEVVHLYDPKNNNYRAYFMAIETGNDDIIRLVKDNIIQRNMVQQEAMNQIT